MPSVVVGALTVALTITVVEQAIRREDDLRREPRRDDVLWSIGLGLRALVSAIVIDYAGHHLDNFRPVPGDAFAMIEQWLAGYDSEDYEPPRGQLLNPETGVLDPPPKTPMLLDEGFDLLNVLERHRDRDRDVIPEDLTHAIDGYAWHIGQARTLFSLRVADTDEDALARSRSCRHTVVEATRDIAEVIRRHQPKALVIVGLGQEAAASYNARLRALRGDVR
jgi:hypothetical protein